MTYVGLNLLQKLFFLPRFLVISCLAICLMSPLANADVRSINGNLNSLEVQNLNTQFDGVDDMPFVLKRFRSGMNRQDYLVAIENIYTSKGITEISREQWQIRKQEAYKTFLDDVDSFFKEFDADSNKEITEKEFRNVILSENKDLRDFENRYQVNVELYKRYYPFDNDLDGKITFDDAKNLQDDKIGSPAEADFLESLWEQKVVFEALLGIDLNGDGKLTDNERDNLVFRAFDLVDQDKNGSVSEAELGLFQDMRNNDDKIECERFEVDPAAQISRVEFGNRKFSNISMASYAGESKFRMLKSFDVEVLENDKSHILVLDPADSVIFSFAGDLTSIDHVFVKSAVGNTGFDYPFSAVSGIDADKVTFVETYKCLSFYKTSETDEGKRVEVAGNAILAENDIEGLRLENNVFSAIPAQRQSIQSYAQTELGQKFMAMFFQDMLSSDAVYSNGGIDLFRFEDLISMQPFRLKKILPGYAGLAQLAEYDYIEEVRHDGLEDFYESQAFSVGEQIRNAQGLSESERQDLERKLDQYTDFRKYAVKVTKPLNDLPFEVNMPFIFQSEDMVPVDNYYESCLILEQDMSILHAANEDVCRPYVQDQDSSD